MVNDSISAAIADSGYKQKYVAERIGLKEQTLCDIISGRRKVSVDEFFKMCQVLQKTPEELYYYKREDKAV